MTNRQVGGFKLLDETINLLGDSLCYMVWSMPDAYDFRMLEHPRAVSNASLPSSPRNRCPRTGSLRCSWQSARRFVNAQHSLHNQRGQCGKPRLFTLLDKWLERHQLSEWLV